VTAVRPPLFPPSPAAQPARPDAGRLTAQKAFFDLALGKAAAPQAAATPIPTPTAALAAPLATARLPDAGAEKPQKILRPGSLLDIRV
jgi:hypothetical protein